MKEGIVNLPQPSNPRTRDAVDDPAVCDRHHSALGEGLYKIERYHMSPPEFPSPCLAGNGKEQCKTEVIRMESAKMLPPYFKRLQKVLKLMVVITALVEALKFNEIQLRTF